MESDDKHLTTEIKAKIFQVVAQVEGNLIQGARDDIQICYLFTMSKNIIETC
jgi:hypothetical protein